MIFRGEGYDLPRELSVSFTGHRADKLPWGRDEEDPRCIDFKRRLEKEIVRNYELGARYFLSGMADGVDIYAAEAVLRLSYRYKDMKLVAVFPFGSGESLRKRRCARRAYRVISLNESYCTGCFMQRNRFLVEHSSRLIAGFSGDAVSGTGATIRMAREAGVGLTIINI